MGRKEENIEMFGSFTEPFRCLLLMQMHLHCHGAKWQVRQTSVWTCSRRHCQDRRKICRQMKRRRHFRRRRHPQNQSRRASLILMKFKWVTCLAGGPTSDDVVFSLLSLSVCLSLSLSLSLSHSLTHSHTLSLSLYFNKVAAILEQLHGKQITSYQASCRWPSTEIIPSRLDEVVINRLRIGHTRCTHSYLLTAADQPDCTTCQCPLTVKHILVDCSDFNDTRNKHLVASSME